VPGERAVLRLMPEQRGAVVLLTNAETGRTMYRSLIPEVMRSAFEIGVPPLRLDPDPGAADELSRFAGTYAWPDRRVEVAATTTGLVIAGDEGPKEASPLDARTFVVDPSDPDVPTVTFGDFDADGRPEVLYDMIWGLPRRSPSPDERPQD
jgi:hypothetical protein